MIAERLRDVSQFELFLAAGMPQVYDSKDGEMSEWFKEHAWKAKRATDTAPRRSTLTHTDQRLNLPDRLLVGLEMPILALNAAFGNVARLETSALR